MESAEMEERIRAIAERVATEHGYEHVHTEVGVLGRNAAVRIFIDKPGGVTHQDCSTVSHHVGTVLEVEDWVNSAYTLEVSSPGLERGLYKRADYERFAGRLAR
jgi:ribosome maturation factor RimP